MNAEQSQLPSGTRSTHPVPSACREQAPEAVVRAPIETRRGAVIVTRNSLFGKQKSVNLRALRRVCAGFVALVAACGASLHAFAEPVETADQAAILRAADAPRNLSAIAEGPARVALSWQAPLAADTSEITGYGIQFSDDGGASWSVLPTASRRATSFVHTVGLRPNATLLYRVFAIGTDGAGPAAAATAVVPRTSVPRITAVRLTANQGSVRWYPPRQEVAVTVQFDQAVTVNTNYGTPQIDLVMGRPPHRQSGYASDYSGGSGTDRLTFRYVTVDWNQDLSDIEVGPNALDLNGGRIVNLHATHRASLAHGPATLEVVPQVDTRSDDVLVLDTRAPAPAPAAPGAEVQIAQYEQSGSPEFAAMLTAAGALVAGTEIVQQLALAERHQVGQRAVGEQLAGAAGDDADDSLATIAVSLGQEAGPRAAVTASAPRLFTPWVSGRQRIQINWTGSTGGTIEGYLLEYSDDAGETWTNLLGYDDQGNDRYYTDSPNRSHLDTSPGPGTTRFYRVTARNGDGLGTPSNVGSATTEQLVPVSACDSAFWSTEIIVKYHSGGGYYGYSASAGTSPNYGTINDANFSFGGTTHIVRSVYFDPVTQFEQLHRPRLPDYSFDVSPGFPTDRWDDLTLHIGQVELPFASVSTHSQQSSAFGGYYGHRWESAQYAGTFAYQDGDWVTVCLVDSSPGVTLALDPASISENDTTTTVTASVERASSTPFTVTVSAEPDSPAVDGDFELSTNKVLRFEANALESTGIVTITAVDNNVHAPNKTVTVSGERSSEVTLRAPSAVELTITNDDGTPELGITVSPATISEADTSVVAIVTVSTAASTFADDQTIALSFDGTATKATDYTVSAETLTLEAGESSVTATVTVVDDTVDEESETILVTATHDSATVGTEQQIAITDNDTATLNVAVNPATIGEADSGSSTVTVSTDGGLTFLEDQTVVLSFGGTATETSDYTVSEKTLTLTAGEHSVTTTVTAVDDAVDDDDETIEVTATHNGSPVGTLQQITITDDDTTELTLAVNPATIEETNTESATVTVTTVGGGIFGQDEVIVLSFSGTATKDSDYTVASETLTLLEGERSVSITVTAQDDSVDDDDETILVTAARDGNAVGTEQQITITDNDVAELEVSVDQNQIAEAGGKFTVTVSSGSITFAEEQTIMLEFDGTAEKGKDYTVSAETLTLEVGATSVTATVTASQDTVDEEDETVTVTAKRDGGAVGAQQTVTITDDDTATFTVTVNPDRIAEADTGTSTVTVSTGSISFAEEQTITLEFGGTAEKDADYTVSAETLTLEAGQTSVSATVTAAQDSVDEDDETVEITAKHGGTTVGTQPEITITDDDTAPFTVTVNPDEITEASGSSEVTVSTGSITFADDLTITLEFGGTAEKGTDYTASSEELTLEAGQTSVSATVTATQDSVDEQDETVTVTAKRDGSTLGSEQTITITDDDTAAFTVAVNLDEIAEADGSSEVTVSTGSITFADDQTISLEFGGTAEKGTDYTVSSETLTLEAGETSVSATVTATQDSVDEQDEMVTVTAKRDGSIVGTQPEITITDDDAATFTVTVSADTVVEAGGSSEVTVSTGSIEFPDDQTITLEFGGTAEKGEDYTVSSETLTLEAGDTSVSATVTASQDSVDEQDETVTVTAKRGGNGVGAQQTIIITDDDTATFTVTVEPDRIAEADTGASTVTVSTGSIEFPDDQTITLEFGGTAEKGTDYTVSSESLMLEAGQTSVSATVTARQDSVDEDNETVTVTAKRDGSTLGSEQTITITDDDTATFTVTVSPAQIAEAGGTSKVTVSTGRITFAEDQTIALELGGTAEKGTDYTVSSESLMLEAGQTSVSATVTASQDTVDEENETVTVTAKRDGSTLGSEQTITITDDDTAIFTVTVNPDRIAEADTGASTVTVSTNSISFAQDQMITLEFGGTAEKDTDYTVSLESLTLEAGQTSVSVTVTAEQDSVDEDNETVTVTAKRDGSTLGTEQTITIADDDTATFTVTVNPAEIAEAGGSSEVTVSTGSITFADNQTITLEFGGAAEKGTDYTVSTETLTLDAGDTSVIFTVTASQDSVDEDNETVEVTAKHGRNTVGTQPEITITDDDTATFTVTVNPEQITEADGSSEVTVSTGSITFAENQTITLEFDGTAEKDTDYSVSSETLTLEAGDTSVSATVTATQDSVDEDNETIEVTAKHAGNSVGTQPEITIADDDTASFTVAVNPDEIAETGGSAEVTVSTGSITFADDQTITLEFGGSAVEGTDYTVSSKTLNLEAGDTSVRATVTATDDSVDEQDETVEITAKRDGGAVGEQQTITITDDDTVAFTVTVSPDEIVEASGSAEVTVSTGSITFAEHQTITLEFGGSAEKGTDYTVSSETLTLTAGQTSVSTTVTATQDTVDEENETVGITVKHDGSTVGTQPEITITDDDTATFTVTVNPGEIAEAGGTSTVAVSTGTMQFSTDQTITLEFGGTAEKGTDYTASSETLTLTAGETSVSTTVTATQDTVVEENETIAVTAKRGGSTVGAQQTITITDDDMASFTVTVNLDTIAEAGGSSAVEVNTGTITFAADQTVTLEFDGTALKDTDYTVSSETLTLEAGQTSVSATVTASQDMVDEDSETVEVTAKHDGSTVGMQQTITITDDDTATFAVTVNRTSIAEAGGSSEVTVSTGSTPFAENQTITLEFGGTAEKDTDYTVSSETLTLVAGKTSVAATVTASQDTVDEDNETVTVTAKRDGSTVGTQPTITITDDDTATFTVTVNPDRIAEANTGASTVTVNTGSITFAEDQTITLEFGGTAEKGTDYTVSSETLTLEADQTSVSTTVSASQDSIDEDNETVTVTAKRGGNVIGTQPTITITDDDTATFTVTVTRQQIAEAGGSSTVTVSTGSLTFAEDQTITLEFGGTAEKGTDYTVSSETLTLEADQTSVSTTVSASQDSVDEDNETVTVTAKRGGNVVGAQPTITITDDDTATFTVTVNPDEIAEAAGASTVTVSTGSITFPANRTITLEFGGTAAKGTDYTVLSDTLTLEADSTSVSTTVTASQDSVDEDDETVTVTAKHGGSTVGTRQTITITDDDTATFTVTVSPDEIAEAGGSSAVTVSTGSITFPDNQTITLEFSGTAVKGTDYTVSSEMVTLVAGQSSARATVTASNDNVDDDDETILVTAKHGQSAVGTQQTITIADDDTALYAVNVNPERIAESGGRSTVTVSTTGRVTLLTDQTITLEFRGTAAKGTDYIVSAETLTLDAGQTSVSATVTAQTDAVDEADESILVTAKRGQTVLGSEQSITIADDDAAVFTLSVDPDSVAEANTGSATVTLSTGRITFVDEQTISLSFNGTATKGSDYTVSTETLTLSVGDTSATTTVTAVNDKLDEDTETIAITATHSDSGGLVQQVITIVDDDRAPSPPTDVKAVPSDRQVTLNWKAPSDPGTSPLTGYVYRFKTGTGSYPETWTEVSGGASAVTTSISSLRNDTEYTFALAAVSDAGQSVAVEITATPALPNEVPRFTSNSAFTVQENQMVAGGTVTAVDDDSDSVTGYAITDGVDKEHFAIGNSGILLFSVPPDYESAKDVVSTDPVDAAGNNVYVVVVKAISGTGNREATALQTITVTVTDQDEPPLKPAKPTVRAASPTSVSVTWSEPQNTGRPPITDYDYRYRELTDPPGGSWTEVTDTESTDTRVTIPDLAEETKYEVQILARNDEGAGGWSDSGIGSTLAKPVVTLVLDPASIAEAGTSTITATVTPASTTAFEIEVSAAAVDEDHNDAFDLSTNKTLSFAANGTASTGAVTISAVDNDVDEADKLITVSGTVTADADVIAPDDQTLTIKDDDVLAAVTAGTEVLEEGERALFPVKLTGGTTTADVVIGYKVEGTAAAGTDYTKPSGKLTIDAGRASGTITIQTDGDDEVLDPGETLIVTLTSGTTSEGGVELNDTPAEMTITDDGMVNVSIAAASATEGDAMTFTVTLTGSVASKVAVDWATGDVAATAGTDYTAVSAGKLTFASGVKTGTLSVTTLEDAIVEGAETFQVTLSAPDLPDGVALSQTAASAVGTITDDDSRGVNVSPRSLELNQGASGSYSVSLTSQPTANVTVTPSSSDSYASVSSALTFTPQNWSTSQQISVTASSSAPDGGTARITHTVRGGDYAGVTALPVSVTIKEPSEVESGVLPKNSGSSSNGFAGAAGDDVFVEGDTIRFVVNRSRGSQDRELTVTVRYSQEGRFIDANAMRQAYGAIPDEQGEWTFNVKIARGESRVILPVATLDDALDERDGSVTQTIEACAGCGVSAVSSSTIAVHDNDSDFRVSDAGALENFGEIVFEVELRPDDAKGVPLVPVTLQYETRNGSATAGKDYKAGEGRVEFASGQSTATIKIEVIDDHLVESDETFRLRVFHPIDPEADKTATGTIKDDDAAVAKAWLSRFGRTVASHVVEAVDARLTGELGPTTQVTLGGTTLPSAPTPIQPNAAAAMPHTTMEGGAFLAGSSFQVLASDTGGESAGTGLTMWGRGAATGLQAIDKVVSSLKGQVGTATVGVDYDWGGILAGLAVAYSGGGADYKLAGEKARADEAESWLISAHPYARAQILGDRLTAWGLLGFGLGQMTLAKDSEDETGISMMMGALGLRGVLSPETNRFGLTVKSDAFLTHMTAGEGGMVTTGAHRARLLAEGTYRMDFGAGGVLIPRLVTGVRYDFGDAEEGFGAEMGGAVTYTYPAWGLTASGNLRVLLTHQDSGFEQWGGGGSLRVTPGAAGLGPSVAVNTSLGAPASGVQRLWTSGVALGSAPAASAAPGAHIDAEMGYGLTVLDGGGMVTPYVGMAVAEKGARAFRLGGRLSVGPAFSLSVEGERREESAGAAAHAVSVNGALRW